MVDFKFNLLGVKLVQNDSIRILLLTIHEIDIAKYKRKANDNKSFRIQVLLCSDQ